MKNGVLVSGGMAHRTDYLYGRFEFRVRTEEDPSGATSGVVLTWPKSERWPQDGENDIYETGTKPTDRSWFHTYIHYGKLHIDKPRHFKHEADATAWHVMAMEWEPKELRIYRDGDQVWTLADEKVIPHVAHHLCLQLDAFRNNMGAAGTYVRGLGEDLSKEKVKRTRLRTPFVRRLPPHETARSRTGVSVLSLAIPRSSRETLHSAFASLTTARVRFPLGLRKAVAKTRCQAPLRPPSTRQASTSECLAVKREIRPSTK